MLTARFVDHSEEIMELLKRKLLATVLAATKELAHGYQLGLQVKISPPHSRPGEIPHGYAGHKPGGYGPVNKWNEANNAVKQGFARDQGRNDYLANYVEGDAGDDGAIRGFIGFSPSHVVNRRKNYLLMHNEHGRPWVMPLFMKHREPMKAAANAAFEETK